MKPNLSDLRFVLPLLAVSGLVWFSHFPSVGQEQASSTPTTEIFRVSNVGRPNAAETRELLLHLYNEIGKVYNAEAARKFQDAKEAFSGSQVRILKVMSERDAGDPMYLAAYDGSPSVFSIDTDTIYKPGDLTPPLKIESNGEYKTEVTRIVIEQAKSSGSRPSLEKADTSGVPTFFGIPIDTGGGAAPAPSPSGGGGGKMKRKRVTEVRTLPKYRASISREKLAQAKTFSKEIFLEAVKNGEIYEVKRLEERRCKNCGGFQRVQSTLPVGQRAPDGKMDCPPCRGAGKIKWDVTYQVTW
ncbi:MAG: hypothetical protein HKN23_10695 [Verrucomicrobiales bacterium]|nr:hypothetical protein [Verrucomicrobiales bacterium]